MPKCGDDSKLAMKNILKDIGESEKMLMHLRRIPVGETIWIPVGPEKDESYRFRKVQKMKYKVVGKTKRMLVCERNHGIRECFTYNDLLTLAIKYGGLKDGKS